MLRRCGVRQSELLYVVLLIIGWQWKHPAERFPYINDSKNGNGAGADSFSEVMISKTGEIDLCEKPNHMVRCKFGLM